MNPILHGYFRSSAAYRVRIALNLKQIAAEHRHVHLVRDGGEHFKPGFRALNAQGLLPALEHEGESVGQSLAILEYLEENYPQVPLLPAAPMARAKVRAMALEVACEIHPLNNLRVLKYLTGEMKLSEEDKTRWLHHWMALGFAALETQVGEHSADGRFCFGATPTFADCCLIPQVFNARRFKLDLAPYPKLVAIDAHCNSLPAFADARPEAQPDFEKG